MPPGDPTQATARFVIAGKGTIDQQYHERPDGDMGPLVDLLAELLPDADLEVIPPAEPTPSSAVPESSP